MQNVVFLALGTGIGAGLILDGRIYRGCRHAAGEVGNFVMGRQYLGKNRRGHGNLEVLVGGPTIREEAADATGDDLSAAEAIDRADEDKRLAVLAERVADHVAILVVNISALLDPEAIIFGGGTASAGSDLLEPVRERVDRELANPPALMHSVLGEDAQLYGAVWGATQAAAPPPPRHVDTARSGAGRGASAVTEVARIGDRCPVTERDPSRRSG